jgi:hypothetical protein
MGNKEQLSMKPDMVLLLEVVSTLKQPISIIRPSFKTKRLFLSFRFSAKSFQSNYYQEQSHFVMCKMRLLREVIL